MGDIFSLFLSVTFLGGVASLLLFSGLSLSFLCREVKWWACALAVSREPGMKLRERKDGLLSIYLLMLLGTGILAVAIFLSNSLYQSFSLSKSRMIWREVMVFLAAFRLVPGPTEL